MFAVVFLKLIKDLDGGIFNMPNTILKTYQWAGKKNKLYRGEPIYRFIMPKRSSNSQQNSEIFFNWKEGVLTVNHWFDLPQAISSKESLNRYYRELRTLFNPDRQLVVIDNRVIKSNGTVVANVQYFAKLKELPTAEQMQACLEILETKYVGMTATQLQEERYQETRRKALNAYNLNSSGKDYYDD